LIDFTAKWCFNCEVNLHNAIETKKVAELLREQNVVPMIADHTKTPQHIKDKLQELQSVSIPLLAIYPEGGKQPPIVLRDLVSESQVIDAIKQATDSTIRSGSMSAGSLRTGNRERHHDDHACFLRTVRPSLFGIRKSVSRYYGHNELRRGFIEDCF
jgi:hypothetical protein